MSRGYDKQLEEDYKKTPDYPWVKPIFILMIVTLVVFFVRQVFAKPSLAHKNFTGIAKIVDGDTIDIGKLRIRLHGIDAPEAGQRCKKPNGGNWPCGKEAIKAIARLADGKEVHCIGDVWDDFGRLVAVCSVGDIEINKEMVRLGFAWNYDKYSMDYKQLENRIRKARLGVFKSTTTPPWKYRAKRWIVAVQTSPKGCPIKGNISRKGRIYHAPWSPWYKRTKISVDKGERWFCSETEAMKSGWRAPYWH